MDTQNLKGTHISRENFGKGQRFPRKQKIVEKSTKNQTEKVNLKSKHQMKKKQRSSK